jgi:hypothetical protein
MNTIKNYDYIQIKIKVRLLSLIFEEILKIMIINIVEHYLIKF